MSDKLAKPEPEECVAYVVDDALGEPSRPVVLATIGQPATVERVREIVPYDYIWNESTRNYEPVFVPGNEIDHHLRQNEEANRRLMAMREQKLAARNARREPEQLPSKTQTWLDRVAKRLMG